MDTSSPVYEYIAHKNTASPVEFLNKPLLREDLFRDPPGLRCRAGKTIIIA